MKVKYLVESAIMVSLYCILSIIGVSAGAVKISFAFIPVIIGAYMLNWKYGMAIGFIGCFVMQMLRYGMTSTTVLWCIPPCLLGIIIGLYGIGKLNMLVGMVSVTVSNTLAYYIDSKLYGYYTYELIFGTFLVRLFWCVCTTIFYWYIIPKIIDSMESVVKNE